MNFFGVVVRYGCREASRAEGGGSVMGHARNGETVPYFLVLLEARGSNQNADVMQSFCSK